VILSRFKIKDAVYSGLIEGDSVKVIESSFFGPRITPSTQTFKLNQVKLLPPCQPSKIIAIGLNYTDHAGELKMDLPTEPLIFMKPSTSIIGPFDEILYPESVERLDYEAELAIVVKKLCKNIRENEAKDYILGYTCLNDVTARDLQKKDKQWTRSKSFDTFCPLGPFIITDMDADNLDIQLFLNNETRQSSNTKNLIFQPHFLISFVSKICTLLPGDIIATGTPSGIGPMKRGDEVEVRIQGIGSLKNRVVGVKR